jgi:hypothetical protein
MTHGALRERLAVPDDELGDVIRELEREGRIQRAGGEGDAARYESSLLLVPLV